MFQRRCLQYEYSAGCHGQPATERTCVTALKQTAEKLEALHPYYDRHYNGHIGYADAKSLYADAGVSGAGLYRSVRKLARPVLL